SMPPQSSAQSPRWALVASFAAGVVLTCAAGLLFYWKTASARTAAMTRALGADVANARSGRAGTATSGPGPGPGVVTLTRAQQEAIGLTVVAAAPGVAVDVIEEDGQVVPDESKFAYITPRAPGIVRAVGARLGQDVQTGSLLAMIDSSEVAKARFD